MEYLIGLILSLAVVGARRRRLHVVQNVRRPGCQPRRCSRATAIACLASEAAAEGNSTRKELPFPSSLATKITARWAVQIAFTIERPSPAPPEARERALSAR